MYDFQPIPTPTASPTDKTGGGFGQMAGPPSMNGTNPNFNPNLFRNNSGNTNQAPVLLGVGGSLLFISICLLVARLWSRTRPTYRLKLDDWTVFGATILAIIQYFIIAASVFNGLGRRTRFVPAAQRSSAMRLLFISQLFWYWSMTLVKLSVAILLLRLKHTRPWRFFLYFIMGVTISAAIVQTCFQFLQCRPFSVFWDPRVFKGVQCFRRSIINGNIIVFSSIQVGLDLIFSFIPITFIRKLKRPRREKIFMCVLMCFGLFASCAAVIRTLTLQDYYTSRDLFRTNVTIALWAVLEQQLALIGATMPTLKSFMERSLVKIGLWFYDAKSEEHVRGELIKLGLLGKEETLVRNESEIVGRRPSAMSAGERKVGSVQSNKTKTRDQWGDTNLDPGEKEMSFEEMVAKSAKEKEFV
ncbi:hypothetical protein N0V90_008654 [Kalmusia sp. IMI 367209]|nr:hypothetical protein N0V90_008654 [Kalmusia sp. IMI 367209]